MTDESRERAYDLLRGLTYMQTVAGEGVDADRVGNVVLWMQPDGTLNPSPTPVELPDPSDTGESYWLARTIWALGEGYAAFSGTADEDFAAFLKERLDLAIAALQRQTLARYPDTLDIDGRATPAWLVVNGADASAEAVLGLAAYVRGRGTGDRAHRAAPARRGHRRPRGGRRPALAVRSGAAVGPVPGQLARLGVADAGRAGSGR